MVRTVLITSPSLDPNLTVSGMASVVTPLISSLSSSPDFNVEHLEVGRRQASRSGRLMRELKNLYRVFRGGGRGELLHLNVALDKKSLYRDGLFCLLSRLAGRPVLLHLHGGKYIHETNLPASVALTIRILLRLSAKVLVLGNRERDWLSTRFSPPSGKVLVLPNAVGIPYAPTSRQYTLPLKMIFLGRMDPEKGLDVLADAFEAAPELRSAYELHVYGEGTERDRMCNRFQKLMGPAFAYKGIAGKDKLQTLATYDLFILTSRQEGLPMAMLEAMSVGVPPVVSAVGSVPEVIRDGVNGYLVEIDQPMSVAARLSKIAENPSMLGPASAQAVSTVEQNYSQSAYMEKIKSIYQNID